MRTVLYRIAYIAFVLEKSKNGFVLCRVLRTLASWNPGGIFSLVVPAGFGAISQYLYQIQVALEQEKDKDCLWVTYDEALLLEKMRDMMIRELAAIAGNHIRLAITLKKNLIL